MGHPKRIELTSEGLLVLFSNHYTSDVPISKSEETQNTVKDIVIEE